MRRCILPGTLKPWNISKHRNTSLQKDVFKRRETSLKLRFVFLACLESFLSFLFGMKPFDPSGP